MRIPKTLYACAAVAAISTVVLVAACGGGSGGASAPAEGEAALRFAQPGELVAYFRSRIVERVPQLPEPVGGGGAIPSPPPGGIDSGISGTNLQETGVDEDDLLKSDGNFVYALSPGYVFSGGVAATRLDVSRIQPDGTLTAAGGVALEPQSEVSGMYLLGAAQRVAVLGRRQDQLSLDVFDVSTGGQPARTTQVAIDGTLISSRRIGNVLYLASTWAPDLNQFQWPAGTPAEQVEASLVPRLQASALLPTIRTDGGPSRPLVAEQDCLVQPASTTRSVLLTTITAIDLSTPALERRSLCFIGNGNTLYMSASAAYVATSRNYRLAGEAGSRLLPARTTTDVHKFALQGLQVGYRGSAEVTGHLGWDSEKMPYRMSEYQGDLRVLTYNDPTGWGGGPVVDLAVQQAPASPATLTVLRENAAAGRLEQIATLPNAQRPAPIGHANEQVYAVRFAGPLAYVVTFRITDPLYVLDLSDPADPKTAGELAIPGFSDYLFPLANGKLLGVGKDATPAGARLGLKIALFEISNPARPALLSSRSLGERGSTSALDHTRHGVSIFTQGAQARIALPVQLTSNPYSPSPAQQGLARFVVDTAAGTLDERPLAVTTRFDGTDGDADRYARFRLRNERSIQSARGAYYLSGGQVQYIPQP